LGSRLRGFVGQEPCLPPPFSRRLAGRRIASQQRDQVAARV